jgi:predicted Ser/Thr protein kinase
MASTLLKTGFVIDQRYRVESLLGQGGLGAVYRCHDLRNETPVALKLLRSPNLGEEESSLCSEFSILSRLRHANLVRILDFGRLEGFAGHYVVEEYIEGNNLFEATKGWPIMEILETLAELCRVVQYLHECGVVHRDLKPGNILLASSPDGRTQLKVLDFGLAQRFSDEKKRKVSGTLAYMAPEVLVGRRAGPPSDLYSLGVLFYQVLSRRLPFEDEDPGYLIQKHLQGNADLRPVEQLEYGSRLARVIAELLEKQPERRPDSAKRVIQLLSQASGLSLGHRSASAGEFYSFSSNFVGRENEMELLRQRAHQVRDTGRGWTVFIAGESGSGKSRCMEELRIWALLEGWRVVQGRCTANERRLYGPYREILDSTGIISPELAPVRQRAPELSSALPGTSAVSHSYLAQSTALEFRNKLTGEIMERLSGRPTLVLLHDFHWADEATAAVLDYLTSDILAHPIFLCVSVL